MVKRFLIVVEVFIDTFLHEGLCEEIRNRRLSISCFRLLSPSPSRPPVPSSADIGKTLLNYRITEKLGTGGREGDSEEAESMKLKAAITDFFAETFM